MIKNQKNIKLFGTDGIRGKANCFPILPEIILKVGQALGNILLQGKMGQKNNKKKVVLIGKDTRLSGYMLEQALASGLNSMGVWVQLTGPLPTPGIGFLAQNMRADAGVIISASHNLYQDNGIKIFGADGFKISFELEQEIEKLVFSDQLQPVADSEVGRTRRIDDASGRYIVFVKRTFPHHLSLNGLKIVLDCANGAAYKAAPAVFEELGAEVVLIGNQPDGYNINRHCGAVYPDHIQKAVLTHKADVGVSLDGDADRVVMVDEQGQLLNGDHILGISALRLQKSHQLNKVVSTQMANKGLENLLNKNDIQLIRVDVGDKNVTNRMVSEDILLGGEPSGHIIFFQHGCTGDACIAALNVLAVMILENKKLSLLRNEIQEIPQLTAQVPVQKKICLEQLSGYSHLNSKITKKLKNKGRFYVRLSGTEPLARIMVEGEDQNLAQQCLTELSQFLQTHLN